MKKIKAFFLILIFLQLTDGYKIILLLFNQKTKIASIITLVLCLSYVFFNYKIFFQLFKNSIFKHWLRIITILPIFFHCYHLVLNNIDLKDFIYWISLNLMFGSLFTVSAMISFVEKKSNINFLLISAVIFTILGLAISVFYFPFILRLEILTGDTRYDPDNFFGSVHRAVGFYGQPNLAAKALLVILVMLSGTYLPLKKNLIKIFIILVMLFSIFWTGSRTAILVSIIVLVIYNPLVESKLKGKSFKGIGIYKFFLIAKFFLPIIILLSFMPVLMGFFNSQGSTQLLNRFSIFTTFLSGENSSFDQDISINQRLGIINSYIDYIFKKPFFGHGITLREDLISNDIFDIGAQNEYLELSLAFGIIYIFYYLYVLFKTFGIKPIRDSSNYLLTRKALKVYIILIFIYGFSLNYLYVDRVTIIILGLLMGILFKEKKTFLNKKR